jgi:hypothetical protein
VSITGMRQAIANNIANNISGIRVSYYIPDNPNPPQAIVTPPTIRYDQSFGRGIDEYSFQVIVLATRADERTGQELIDTYCAPIGTGSIKDAIESDKTLGGLVADLRVTDMTGVTPTTLADGQVYLTATWSVTVFSY